MVIYWLNVRMFAKYIATWYSHIKLKNRSILYTILDDLA